MQTTDQVLKKDMMEKDLDWPHRHQNLNTSSREVCRIALCFNVMDLKEIRRKGSPVPCNPVQSQAVQWISCQ